MADTLTAADRKLLTAVQAGHVSYSPGARGGHLWERWDPETRTHKTVTGSRMTSFVGRELVHPPKPRAAGTARITDAGELALANVEA
ncbi:hypothetical protein [Paractinoplanes toevensis]|uniref:Uncharacterized protein n=1 Tax=Paractinoplanes toevensis TaxID=571911 RepID=A0A919T505_9ACTN|nr:hypothetical protein [Actinoplanes toevensis]GIM88777.1 hypothetical protein Ato02nite_005700 [Actinoplanes toevensis]